MYKSKIDQLNCLFLRTNNQLNTIYTTRGNYACAFRYRSISAGVTLLAAGSSLNSLEHPYVSTINWVEIYGPHWWIVINSNIININYTLSFIIMTNLMWRVLPTQTCRRNLKWDVQRCARNRPNWSHKSSESEVKLLNFGLCDVKISIYCSVLVHFTQKSIDRIKLTQRNSTEKSVGRTTFDRKFFFSEMSYQKKS
jgi:hypothetical protein